MTFVVPLSCTRVYRISNGVPFPRLQFQQRRPFQRGQHVLHCQTEKDSENSPEIIEEASVEDTEIRPQEESTTPFGFFVNFLTWSFIIFLFAGSVFFTVSRQFLPDMVPLDPSNPPL